MTESFFTIAKTATGTYKEKGSKFLAFAHPVADFEQIKSKLTNLKKEFYDANHHCYAWVLGPDKSQFKAFDDGEPNHSAGDPILNQIKSKNLTNILVVVVRYFGGVKLGVSGLTSAYKQATQDALEKASVIEVTITKTHTIFYGYPETSVVQKLLNDFHLKPMKEKFGETCSLICEVKLSDEQRLKEKIETLSKQGFHVKLD